MENAAHSARDLFPTGVHIWRIPLVATSAALERYQSLLAPDERDRAARFHFEIHRQRFVIARGRLRILLASYLRCAPEALAFSYTPHGKPYLPERSLAFNLSHAHEMAVLGVTRGRAIGIDIEQIRADLTEGIAERYFASGEVRALRSLPPEQQPAAFFRCWTRKEAYIKAHGEGLSIPLSDFEVCLDDGEKLSITHQRDRHEGARWELHNVPVPAGYISAVVVEGHGLSLQHFDWDDDMDAAR